MLRFTSLITTCLLLHGCTDTEEATKDETNEPEAPTETEEPEITEPEEPSLLTLAEQGVLLESQRWSSAVIRAQIENDTITGVVEYAENWDGEPTYCQTELELTGELSETLCEDLDFSDWCFGFTVELVEDLQECVFFIEDTSFNLADPDVVGFVSYVESATFEDGSTVSNQVEYGFMGENVAAYTAEEDWTFDPQNVVLDMGSYGQSIPNLYSVCDDEQNLSSTEIYISETAQQGTVACDSWEPIADVWTVDLQAGQVLSASLDTQADGVEMRLIFVDPTGCLIDDIWPEAPCSSGAEDCPSLNYPVTTDGQYQLIVTSDWCSGFDEIEYSIDAMVE